MVQPLWRPNYILHDTLLSPLLDPLEGLSMLNCGKLGLEGRSRLPTLKGGKGRARSPGIRLGRGTSIISLESASKTNHKKVSWHLGTPLGVGTSHEHFDTLDSPWPGLGGSHHLPPNGSFSQDSQGGVLRLSQVGVLGLWELIFPDYDIRLERGLNQSYSSPWELSNAMSHSFCRRRDHIESWLLVVGSQIVNLTPCPSFAHNLGCRCSNGSCKAILDIYTSRPFPWHQEHSNARRFDSCNRALNFWVSHRTPTSHFWECEFHPHTYPKVGLRHFTNCIKNPSVKNFSCNRKKTRTTSNARPIICVSSAKE
jgi:hypothetical protein